MTKKEQRINRLFLYAGILTLIYYLGQGITVRFGQSLLYLWLMLSAVCFGRFFLWKWAWKHGKSAPIPRLWLRAVNIVVIAAVAVFLAVECLVFSGAFQKPPEGLDAIIVLGARVDENGPSGSLRQRISAARVYLEENPDTVCIASRRAGRGRTDERGGMHPRSSRRGRHLTQTASFWRTAPRARRRTCATVSPCCARWRQTWRASASSRTTFTVFPRAVSGAEKRRIHVLRRPGPLHRVRLHPLRDARIFHAERVACPRIHLIKPQKRLSVHTAESRFLSGQPPPSAFRPRFPRQGERFHILHRLRNARGPSRSVKHSRPTLSSSSQYV